MLTEEIVQRNQELIAQYGPWNHNILLTNDLYTIGKDSLKDSTRLKLIVQLVEDLAKKPIDQLRILDLGCANGLYAIEFARRGATVVGIEGREANVTKGEFARAVLELNNLEFYQADARILTKELYGTFDVVLCIGLLYHIDVPDVFEFVERLSDICTDLAIIDTHVGLTPDKSYTYKEREYWGTSYFEFAPGTDATNLLSASLDNTESFWITALSLYNLLSEAGFTSAFECWLPTKVAGLRDRTTIVAIKGHPAEVISMPLANSLPVTFYDKDLPTTVHESQHPILTEATHNQQVQALQQKIDQLESQWHLKNQHIAKLENQIKALENGKVQRLTGLAKQAVNRVVKQVKK